MNIFESQSANFVWRLCKTEDGHLLAEFGTVISKTKAAQALTATSSQCCDSEPPQKRQLTSLRQILYRRLAMGVATY